MSFKVKYKEERFTQVFAGGGYHGFQRQDLSETAEKSVACVSRSAIRRRPVSALRPLAEVTEYL
jgi:hypothetical protein